MEINLLESVKISLGLNGNNYHDDLLSGYIDEVKQFLLDAGVSQNVIDDKVSVGVISRGVADLWNYGSGSASLSPYFMQRVAQLRYKKVGEGVDGEL